MRRAAFLLSLAALSPIGAEEKDPETLLLRSLETLDPKKTPERRAWFDAVVSEGGELQPATVEAFEKLHDRLIAEAEGRLKPLAASLKGQGDLAGRRKAALELIEDASLYADPPEGMPPEGQKDVDLRLQALEVVWKPLEKFLKEACGAKGFVRTMAGLMEIEDYMEEGGDPLGEYQGSETRFRVLLPDLDFRGEYQAYAAAEAVQAANDVEAARGRLLAPEEAGILRLVNRTRVMLGRPALRLDPGLAKAARRYSVSHHNSGGIYEDQGLKTGVLDRAARDGFKGGAVTEILAVESGRSEAILGLWQRSPGSHRNLLDATWAVAGPGQGGTAWTLMLGAD